MANNVTYSTSPPVTFVTLPQGQCAKAAGDPFMKIGPGQAVNLVYGNVVSIDDATLVDSLASVVITS